MYKYLKIASGRAGCLSYDIDLNDYFSRLNPNLE